MVTSVLPNNPRESAEQKDIPTDGQASLAASSPSGSLQGRQAARGVVKRYRRSIWAPFMRAIREYRLLSDGDRVAVCISGGKDSMLMAVLFEEFLRHGWIDIDITYLVMDPGYDADALRSIENNARQLGIPIHIMKTPIFEAVSNMDGNPCYPCARMRRGALYELAGDLGCNKIALGHHYDDVIETVLMGMLYGGQIKTMMPKLRSANHPGMELVRPLYLVREVDIVRWRDESSLQFIHCSCPLANTCDDGSKRDEVKALIRQLSQTNPQVAANIFHSVDNVNLDAVTGYSWEGERHGFLEWYEGCGGPFARE